VNPAIATLTILAIVVTKLTDYFRNVFDPKARFAAWVWQTVALALGLVISFVWQVNMLEAISHTPAQGIAGQVLTGLGMGAAAGGYHELFDALSASKKKR
jgi:hypothetical protein